jgi:hypothetical protein
MGKRKNHSWPSKLPIIVIALLSLIFASCDSRRDPSPSLSDIKKWPYKQASAYSVDVAATLAKPVADRIGAAPPLLLDYLRQVDQNPAYASYSLSDAERDLFTGYFQLLPERLRAVMEAKLLGVYFIRNFAGGGMSDYVFRGTGPDDGSMLVILILNPRVLETSLSDWIAYRDASPYEDDGQGLELRSSCSGDYKGLVHTLTHEAAHIYDYFEGATPYVEAALAPASASAESRDFTKGIWTAYSSPAAAYSIPRLSELSAYGLGKKLPLSAAEGQYAALAKTPFASLYGASSWAEDFAESVAWAWLGKRLGISYEVGILRGGREELRFSPGQGSASDARKSAVSRALD